MTNFAELTQTWQRLHALAPDAFTPIDDEASLKRATAALKALDREMGEFPDHPLASLAETLMHRITAYEAVYHPIPDADGAAMLAFYLDQRGLTQQELTAQTGISQGTLSRLLNRKRTFTADHARVLGRAFKVDPGVFL